jgi:c-di-AMP phosphodiesterase-like protein
MASTCFQLKRSFLALCFQLLVFILIIALVLMSLSSWFILFAIVSLVLSYLYFAYQPRIIQLEYLAQNEWTLINNKQQIQRDGIKKIIDHQMYIIIFFDQHQPLAIWCDQLNWQDWKHLKVLAKLY